MFHPKYLLLSPGMTSAILNQGPEVFIPSRLSSTTPRTSKDRWGPWTPTWSFYAGISPILPRTGQGRVGLWGCHPMSLDHCGAVLKCSSSPQSGFQTDSHSENQLIHLQVRIGERIRPQVLTVQYSLELVMRMDSNLHFFFFEKLKSFHCKI
jgi:hypothetical protein